MIAGNQVVMVVCIALYAFVLIAPIWRAIKRGVRDAKFYSGIVSSLVITMLPGLLGGWLASQNLVPGGTDEERRAQADLLLGVAMTISGCANIFIFFIVTYNVRSAGGPQVKPLVHLYETAIFVAALVTLVLTLGAPEWFIRPSAYKAQDYFPLIWPPTVKSGMNGARILIGLLLIPSFFVIPPKESEQPSDSSTTLKSTGTR